MSEFLFNTGKQYLTEKQTENLHEYLARRPEKGYVYVLGDKHFIPCGDRFPKGAITHETYNDLEAKQPVDGTKNYRTPCATLDEKHVLLWVEVIDVKKHTCESATITGNEWLEIAGNAVKTKREEAELLYKTARINQKIAQARASGDPFAAARVKIEGLAEGITPSKKVSTDELKRKYDAGEFPKGDVTFASETVKPYQEQVKAVRGVKQ